jgi:hypothetical protein
LRYPKASCRWQGDDSGLRGFSSKPVEYRPVNRSAGTEGRFDFLIVRNRLFRLSGQALLSGFACGDFFRAGDIVDRVHSSKSVPMRLRLANSGAVFRSVFQRKTPEFAKHDSRHPQVTHA